MDTFTAGQLLLNGSAQQLTGIQKNSNGAVLRAHSGNAGKVYVGSDNTVSSTTGYELAAGESLPVVLTNPSKLWVIGTNGDRVSWANVRA